MTGNDDAPWVIAHPEDFTELEVALAREVLALRGTDEPRPLIIEERDAFVTLTVRLTTRISFVRAPREGRITNSDFIENAIGSLPHGWLEAPAEEGWKVAYPIDGEVHEEP